MKILCAWCLVLIRETPEPGNDSHGICERCSAENFGDVSDTETIDESPRVTEDEAQLRFDSFDAARGLIEEKKIPLRFPSDRNLDTDLAEDR